MKRGQRIAYPQTRIVDLHVRHMEGSSRNALVWIYSGSARTGGLPVSLFVRMYSDTVILVSARLTSHGFVIRALCRELAAADKGSR